LAPGMTGTIIYAQSCKTYTCMICGEKDNRDFKAALDHDYDSGVITTVSTCVDEGVLTFTCKRGCGSSYTEPIAKDINNHIGGTYEEVITPATLVADGVVGAYCSSCGALLGTRPTEKLVCKHDYEGKVTKVATCAEEGEIAYICSECGDSYSEPIAKDANHHVGRTYEEVITPPTQEADGVMGIYCSGCDTLLSTMPIHPDPNSDILKAVELIEKSAPMSAKQADAETIEQARRAVETLIENIFTENGVIGVSATVADGNGKAFTAAKAGTIKKPIGSNGSYTFTVRLSKGDGTIKTTVLMTMIINWAPYDPTPDNEDIARAKESIEIEAVYKAAQASCGSINKARSEAKSAVDAILARLSLNTVATTVVDGIFTPAVAGTVEKPEGTNGSYTFTVVLNKGGGASQTTEERTLIITATPYVSKGGGPNKETFVVTFYVDGEIYDMQTVTSGGTVKNPSPNKTGYTLANWTNVGSGAVYDFKTKVTTDITLNANWMAIVYRITYNLTGGTHTPESIANPTSYTIDDIVMPTGKPVREGYEFIGWEPGNFEAGSVGNVEFIAKWRPQSGWFEVTISNGVTTYVQTIREGGLVSRPANPSMSGGYKFDHWEVWNGDAHQINLDKPYDFNAQVTSSFTLIAIWAKNGNPVQYMYVKPVS